MASFINLPALAVLLLASMVHSAPGPFTKVGDKCYWVNTQPMSWSDAKAECAKEPGATLALPMSQAIQNQLTSWSGVQSLAPQDIWIGLQKNWEWCDADNTQMTWDDFKFNCAPKHYDIQFLVDHSISIVDSEFSYFLDFIKLFSNEFDIGPTKTQIGVTGFGTTVTNRFYMNAYTTTASLLAAINIANIPNSGGVTKTWLGLDWVKDNVFAGNNGDRAGVDNIVIVLTDGESGSFSATQAAAAALHTVATVYSVGVGSPNAELTAIASNPGYAKVAATWPTVVDIVSDLHALICGPNPDVAGPCASLCPKPDFRWSAHACDELKVSVCEAECCPNSANITCPNSYGYYPVGCDNCHFWQCGNGIAYKMPCAPGTVWNQAFNVCDHPVPPQVGC